MAMANVQEVAADHRRDKVLADYEDMLRELRTLKDLSDQSESVMKSAFIRNWMDKMEGKRRDKAAEWAESHYKPKNFAVDQPRVLAIKEVIRELREFADEQKTNFERAWRAKAAYEGQWSLFIPQLRAIEARLLPDIGEVKVKPEPTPEATVEEVARPADSGVTLHVLTVPLAKGKANKAIRKALEGAGFTHIEEDGAFWHWSAAVSEVADAVYEQMCDADGNIVTKCWENNPAQTEISVDEDLLEDPTQEPRAVSEPKSCTIVTRAMNETEHSDLADSLSDAGFEIATKDEDAGELTWGAEANEISIDFLNSPLVKRYQDAGIIVELKVDPA